MPDSYDEMMNSLFGNAYAPVGTVYDRLREGPGAVSAWAREGGRMTVWTVPSAYDGILCAAVEKERISHARIPTGLKVSYICRGCDDEEFSACISGAFRPVRLLYIDEMMRYAAGQPVVKVTLPSSHAYHYLLKDIGGYMFGSVAGSQMMLDGTWIMNVLTEDIEDFARAYAAMILATTGENARTYRILDVMDRKCAQRLGAYRDSGAEVYVFNAEDPSDVLHLMMTGHETLTGEGYKAGDLIPGTPDTVLESAIPNGQAFGIPGGHACGIPGGHAFGIWRGSALTMEGLLRITDGLPRIDPAVRAAEKETAYALSMDKEYMLRDPAGAMAQALEKLGIPAPRMEQALLGQSRKVRKERDRGRGDEER